MRIGGKPYRTIWLAPDGRSVEIIDQTRLPHEFAVVQLATLDDAARAIETMQVRGAPLVGATAAYGVCLALSADASDESLAAAGARLRATRPTAINLVWALETIERAITPLPKAQRVAAAYAHAAALCDDDVATCRAIGEHGLALLTALWRNKSDGRPLNILTHCNAGWLATVDWGTALAPIYAAHDAGVSVHVWVDETRPRNQGASLTAWELVSHGVPHTVIVDNAGGHLMQRGDVDVVMVGTDRTTANGDVCNKIGTYLKALAAHDNGVPFYAAVPGSSIDWSLTRGSAIPIEQRSEREVTHIHGVTPEGTSVDVRLTPSASPAFNPAFDVTPARLVTGLITERGVTQASVEGLRALYPDRQQG